MKPKLYFDNPYDALFMNVNHGVRLLTRTDDEYMEEYNIPEDQRYYDYFDTCEVDGMGCEAGKIGEVYQWIEEVSPSKIWVHPDNESIFEPQEGDLIYYELLKDYSIFKKQKGYHLIQEHPRAIPLKQINSNGDETTGSWMQVVSLLEKSGAIIKRKIIQRNGLPFIMPQQDKGDM